MAIETDVEVRTSGFFLRWMSVKQLKQILSELEDEDILYPNRVGNLTVHSSKEIYKGYIDFNSEVYQPLEEEEDFQFLQGSRFRLP